MSTAGISPTAFELWARQHLLNEMQVRIILLQQERDHLKRELETVQRELIKKLIGEGE